MPKRKTNETPEESEVCLKARHVIILFLKSPNEVGYKS